MSSYDTCYKDITNKVLLECKHELCVMCFLVMTTSSAFKCHMCKKEYKWNKNIQEETIEERLNLLIREDDENQFIPLLVGYFPGKYAKHLRLY